MSMEMDVFVPVRRASALRENMQRSTQPIHTKQMLPVRRASLAVERPQTRRSKRWPVLLSIGSLLVILATMFVLMLIQHQTSAMAAEPVWFQASVATLGASKTIVQKTAQPSVRPIRTTQMTLNASAALMRLNQTDPAQYASQAEYQTWWPSACSPAAMAEVINAYTGKHLHVTDVLQVEERVGAISSSQGLLSGDGIDTTLNQFGFATQTLNQPSLAQIIAIANSGKPVIVAFPPSTWQGGHILVVTGGNAATVRLADSSRLDMQSMTWAQFEGYWRGFAKVATPRMPVTPSSLASSVVGQPTITAAFINQVLAAANSPAAGKGQALYDLGVQYSIDPAFALAFFMHESTFGTMGEARSSLSLGNLRCIPNALCRDNYAWFPTWQAGFQAWYALIRNLYVDQWGLTTVAQIIPRYAPPSDKNNDDAYIASVEQAIDAWHAGKVFI